MIIFEDTEQSPGAEAAAESPPRHRVKVTLRTNRPDHDGGRLPSTFSVTADLNDMQIYGSGGNILESAAEHLANEIGDSWVMATSWAQEWGLIPDLVVTQVEYEEIK